MTPAADLAHKFDSFHRTVINNPFIPHRPTVKQAEFLACTELQELLYGGAAGGGKSEALLMAALQYVHEPNYGALLLRRTFADLALPGALMDRAHGWLQGSDAYWVDREKTWLFPSGATVTFGYLETENDKYRYQSAEFQFVGFDELTQFTETQYRYLFSRLRRRKDSGVPIRMRAASNPGGVGHNWVFRRFVDPSTASAPFISALLEDNPHVDQSEYNDMLSRLDANTRKQLRLGIWKQDPPGALWKRDWLDKARVVRVPDGVTLIRIVVGLDPSTLETGDEAGIVVVALGSDGHYYVLDDMSLKASPDKWARTAITAYHKHRCDRIIYERNQGGKMVERVLQVVDPKVPLLDVWASRGKAVRAEPVAALSEQGRWHHVGTFPELEDELCGWTPDMLPSPNRLDAMVWAGTHLLTGGIVTARSGYDPTPGT